jgi:predicted dinucleotide-binding enzyme
MARGISTRLLAGGNDVTLAARNTTRAAELAKELGAVAKGGATVAVVPFDGPITGDIVILAVPYSSVPSIFSSTETSWQGRSSWTSPTH